MAKNVFDQNFAQQIVDDMVPVPSAPEPLGVRPSAAQPNLRQPGQRQATPSASTGLDMDLGGSIPPQARSSGVALPIANSTPEKYDPLLKSFETYSTKYDVPMDVLMGLIEQESSYNPRALGEPTKWGRAKGLAQNLDATAAGLGINPFDPDQSIESLARTMRQKMDKGMPIEDILREHHGGPNRAIWGPKTAAYAPAVLAKAQRIGGELKAFYDARDALAPKPKTQAQGDLDQTESGMSPTDNRSWATRNVTEPLADVGKSALGGVYTGTASLLRGAGELPKIIGDYTTTPLVNALMGTDYRTANLAEASGAADAVKTYGEGIKAGVSAEGRQAIKDSTPDGDLLKPSTWTFGEKPSIRGIASLGADVFGGMLPIVASTIATSGFGPAVQTIAGAATGGAQGGGGAVEQATETIKKLSESYSGADAEAKQAGQPAVSDLQKQSSYYREQLNAGRTPEEALAYTSDAARRWSYLMTLPVSAVGGALTSKLINPAEKIVASSNLLGRIAGRAGLSGLEEGIQEPAETIQTNRGINAGAGTNLNVTEGTFGDAVLGFIGGAGMGGGAGSMSSRHAPEPKRTPAGRGTTESRTADGTLRVEMAQEDPGAAPEAAPAAPVPPPPPPPAGPATRAMAAGGEQVQSNGTRVVVNGDGDAPYTATVLGDDEGKVWVLTEDGRKQVIDKTDIASGQIVIAEESPENLAAIAQIQNPETVNMSAEEKAARQEERTFRPNDKVVWAGPESDIPVTYVSTEPEPGPDGRAYAKVRTEDGTESYVPASELSRPAAEEAARADPEPVTPPDYDTMDEPALRERLKYIAGQAKDNGGWNKMLADDRRKVERAIEAVTAAQEATPVTKAKPAPAAAPEPTPAVAETVEPTPAPAPDPAADENTPAARWSRMSTAERAAIIKSAGLSDSLASRGFDEIAGPGRKLIAAELDAPADLTQRTFPSSMKAQTAINRAGLNDTHRAMPVGDNWKIQPIEQERADGRINDGGVGSAEAAAPAGAGAQAERAADAGSAQERNGSGATAEPVAGVRTDLGAADEVAEQPAALKWFGSREKADAYIARNNMGDSSEVVAEGKRFEVRPKAAPAAPRAKKAASPTSQRATRAQEIIGGAKVGDIITPSADVGYASAGQPMRVQSIGKDGSVRVENPKTGSGTDLSRADLERAATSGATFAVAPSGDPVAAPSAPSGSTNTVFTEDAYLRARAVLKSKLGTAFSGLDPELIQAGIATAGYHIERGARSFAAYARAMVEDLGDAVRPYLKSWYAATALDPRAVAFEGMSPLQDVVSTDLDAMLGEVSDPDSAEPLAQRVAMVSRLFDDLPERLSLFEQGFDSISLGGQRRVLAQVSRAIKDLEVLRAVVESVPVDVMNVFLGSEGAADQIGRDPSVLVDALSVDRESAIPANVGTLIDTLVSVVGESAGPGAVRSAARGNALVAPAEKNATRIASEGVQNQNNLPVGTRAENVPANSAEAAEIGLNDLAGHLRAEIAAGRMPKDNPALAKMVESFDGDRPTPERMKVAQEALEAAIVGRAREIVSAGTEQRATFDALVDLYKSQPNLNVRTSTSIANQAYSTPAPLAYLASQLAHVDGKAIVSEPTAGTGMLLIAADPALARVNELNPERAALLEGQGFTVTQRDAAAEPLYPADTIDAVLTNPPFGSVKDADGKPVKESIDGYKMGQIDHVIAARALQTMKDDGRATLILGANKVAGMKNNDDLVFFNWLYGNYNVVGHFEVDGKLYSRQGASWPVRVITINGRQKSARVSPPDGAIQRQYDWEQVYGQAESVLAASRDVPDVGANPPSVSDEFVEADRGPALQPAGAEAGADGGARPARRARGAGDVVGAGTGTVGAGAAAATGAAGRGTGAQRRNDAPAGRGGVEQAGQAGAAGAAGRARGAGSAGVASAEANQFQAIYTPRSARKDEGVLIPVNMKQPIEDSLNRLEDAVGNIDDFAAKELGYASTEELHGALMGLQVDSVASAINQIKSRGKATIIADQTGIGKGRQAAAMIRWAARNDMIPVFLTVKPQLFSDMYGDLTDIGSDDIAPFIMNTEEAITAPNGQRLFANRPAQHRKSIAQVAATGQLPEGRNALFLTYSQINTNNAQREAVMAIAPRALFIMDESHNAGGDSSTGEFMRGALDLGQVTYLSATYAKRPDNMPLYFKTDIGDAVSDSDGLMNAMSAGGLPLQTVVANNLVRAGQMFRRERSYAGVDINTKVDTDSRARHEQLSDTTTLALRAIVDADKTFHALFVKGEQKRLADSGGRMLDNAGNQASASVNHTQFSSVVHNFVRQMLLGLKAQAAADEAIEALRSGEKPIIAVENTMGSFLAEYAANNGLKPGDSLGDFGYRNVLSRALERSRVITVVAPNGEKTKRTIRLDQLGPETRLAYDKAQKIIDGLDIDIPVSPIDWMRQQLVNAGHSVAEITGRSMSVDYTDPANPKLTAIDAAERDDKVSTTRAYNGGQLDALVLNVAGSTGISLHASERFADQRPRRMIVAQAAQDINIFMQMLGRIHRTGQVVLPSYSLLSVDLPAEKRPTAILSGKMKSLNANTSSNTESATSVASLDMLNKYGDRVVGQYLQDNSDLAEAMDLEGELLAEDIARKATGRLALMPVETQRQFYEEVESQYSALMDYLNKTNQNDLEPRTYDFGARELRSQTLFNGPNPESPFGEDATYGEYSVKAQGKAMTPEEIRAEMKENLGGVGADEHAQSIITTLAAGLEPYLETLSPEQRAAATVSAENGRNFIRAHPIGSAYRLNINEDTYNGVVMNVRSTHKARGNPFALSKIQVTVALNGSLRSLTIPASQMKEVEVSMIGRSPDVGRLFDAVPRDEREVAKIVTGNLLGAYGEMDGTRGAIISFTKADGTLEQGILLPKGFSMEKDARHDYRLRDPDTVRTFLRNSTSDDIERFGVMSRDSVVRVLPEGDSIVIRVPKSKARGGKYFLDQKLIEQTGDFVSVGETMRVKVPPEKASAALDVLMKKTALYALPSMAEEAREMFTPVEEPAAAPAVPGIRASVAAPAAAQAQTDTPAFKKWFEASKVARADGTPLVVYRGRQPGSGDVVRSPVAYFTADKRAAQEYADQFEEGSGTVLDAYVSIQNPATEQDIERVAAEKGIDLLVESRPAGYLEASPELVAALKEAGYDGAYGWDDRPDNGGEVRVWAAFSSPQVKSATGNNGNFDATNPNIRASQGEAASPLGTVKALRDVLVNGPYGTATRALLDSGAVVLHENASTLPAGVSNTWQGATMPDGRIHLLAQVLTERTANAVLLHEAFHSGGDQLTTAPRWQRVMSRIETMMLGAEQRRAAGTAGTTALAQWWDRALDRVEHANVAGETRAEELAAYAVENRENAPVGLLEALDNLIGQIKAYLVRRFGVQFGDVTPGQLRALAIAALRAPRTVSAGPDGPPSGRRERSSVPKPAGSPKKGEIDSWFGDKLETATTATMPALLATVPLYPLIDEIGKRIPSLRTYLTLKQKMDTYRQEWIEKTQEVISPWLKFASKDVAGNKVLMDLMHDTTLAQVDPSKPFKKLLTPIDERILDIGKAGTPAYESALRKQERDVERKAAYKGLVDRYQAMPAEAKAMYETVRESYRSMADERDNILLENASRAMDLAMDRANEKHAEAIRQIQEDGLAGATRQAALDAADQDLAAAATASQNRKATRMTRLREEFETNRLAGPYFRLARFGKYFVHAQDGDKTVSFSRFESRSDQKAALREMKAAGYQVKQGVIDDLDGLRQQVDPRFMADIEDMLGAAGVTSGLRDEIWQRYLESMPDLSLRTRQIHRKGTAGYESDAVRAYSDHMFHGAHQTARMRYAQEMGETLKNAASESQRDRDPVRSKLVVQEVAKRHEFAMSPTNAPWAQAVSTLAFMKYLAGTPAHAIINLTQTPMIGLSTLAAYEGTVGGGFTKATGAMLGALRDFLSTASFNPKNGQWTAAKASRLTQNERLAMTEAYASGLVDRSQAHDLAGVASRGVGAVRRPKFIGVLPLLKPQEREKILSIMSWGAHQTERLNREVTFLAAYRMAVGKGEAHEQAIKTGMQLTYRTHFDYQNSSRPRIMQGDVGKAALVFRNFSLNMLTRAAIDIRQSVAGETAAERKEAKIRFLGTTAMMAMSAGIKGTWFIGTGLWLASTMFGGDDDDLMEKVKKMLANSVGEAAASVLWRGVMSVATGTDISGRIGMGDLWVRSPDRELEGADQTLYWLGQMGGAGLGVLTDTARSLQMMGKGEIQRGAELLTPKMVADGMKAFRFATEGAETLKGAPIKAEFSPYELLLRASGFQPLELSRQYEYNTAVTNREKAILGERTKLLDSYYRASEADDTKKMSTIQADIDGYNSRYPEKRIMPKDIVQSIKTRDKNTERTEGGIRVDRKLNDRLRSEAPPRL